MQREVRSDIDIAERPARTSVGRRREPSGERSTDVMLAAVAAARADGLTLAEAIAAAGAPELEFYRAYAAHGALARDQVARLRRLEKENARLRRRVSQLMLEKLELEEASWSRY